METLKNIDIILIIILFACWNGVVIKWFATQDKKYSELWHLIGFIIRGLAILLLIPNWDYLLIALNVSWTVYDAVIALIMGQNVFYIGKTSKIDIIIGKWGFIAKGILLIGTIIYILIF